MGRDSVTIIDNRNGKEYEVPIHYGTYPKYGATIDAMALRDIKIDDEDFGLLTYDPGFGNTCSCKSSITFIDGEKGILQYRGYPIQEIAERSTYVETSYLLLHGELPSRDQYREWTHDINRHRMIHENVKKFIDGFHYDAHPMAMLVGTVAGLASFYPNAKLIDDPDVRMRQIWRLIAKIPTMAAFAYRHSRGLPWAYPDDELSYAGNFLNMMFKGTEAKYVPDPVLERALDVLFILHIDHEQNCLTPSMNSGTCLTSPMWSSMRSTASLAPPCSGP